MPEAPQTIAHGFFRIDSWNAIRRLGKGNINDTYLIDFQQDGLRQRFVLQKINTRVFPRPDLLHLNWRRVEHHLWQHSFPLKIPHLIATHPDGWRVLPFFDNTCAPESVATPTMAFEVARAYGWLTQYMADFPAENLYVHLPHFHDPAARWQSLTDTIKKDPAGRVKTAAQTLEKMLAAESIFLKINTLLCSNVLPLRATHNDTKAGNVLLDCRTHRAMAVVDWDTWMPGTVLSDFGDMLRSCAPNLPESATSLNELRLREPVVEAMVRGFLSVAKPVLQPIELENLHLGGCWMIAEQAARFLTDYLAGDVYFKTKHAGQNLQRAENQLYLLQLLQHFEPTLRKWILQS